MINNDWSLKDICAVAITFSSIIVTIILTITAHKTESRKDFTDQFMKIYNATFELKNKIENKVYLEYTGGRFYYEIDLILYDRNIEIALLDYLTVVEDLLVGLGHYHFSRKQFNQLMSWPLYIRMNAVLGFILRLRNSNDNQKNVR